MTVFVNLFQNLGSGYMKLLPEFQIQSISAIEEKKREDNISLYLRADLSPAPLVTVADIWLSCFLPFFRFLSPKDCLLSKFLTLRAYLMEVIPEMCRSN